MKTPSVQNYYAALQDLFQLQSNVMTDVLPHSGERGRNDEERFREFLGRILPKKFSAGTGFIVCSEPSVPVSSQTDVVLFDEFHNSPIHRELTSHVYPVEMVYGTVEVKGSIQKRDLPKICQDIAKIRMLGQHRWYLRYGSAPITPNEPKKRIVKKQELRSKVPPRAFVFAYEKKGWRNLPDFLESLTDAVRITPAHIHGLAILDADWYISQKAFAKDGPKFDASEGNALLEFVNGLLHSIGSVRMRQMSIDRYYKNHRA